MGQVSDLSLPPPPPPLLLLLRASRWAVCRSCVQSCLAFSSFLTPPGLTLHSEWIGVSKESGKTGRAERGRGQASLVRLDQKPLTLKSARKDIAAFVRAC